jgi:hypothetical protein
MKYVLLLPVVALAACVENDLSLTLNRYVAPNAESCTVSPSNQFLISKGVLDVGLVSSLGTGGYIAFPEIQNNLPSGTGTNSVELNAITVTGLDVELIPSAAIEGALPTQVRRFHLDAAGGRLTPGSSVVVSAEVLPRQIADMLAGGIAAMATTFPIITARVKPIGIRSGDTVIGAAVGLPIELCRFCLTQVVSPCPPTGFDSSSVNTGGCVPQQDSGITCCVSSQTLLCGSAVPMM